MELGLARSVCHGTFRKPSQEVAMATADDPDRSVIHYFVDEAGTPTLFRRRRKSIVDVAGCSKFFIL
jgi:hypothetical protein